MFYSISRVVLYTASTQLPLVILPTEGLQITWTGPRGVISWVMIYAHRTLWIRKHLDSVPWVRSHADGIPCIWMQTGGLPWEWSDVGKIAWVEGIITSLQLVGCESIYGVGKKH
jgi:hypothetical protein